MMLLLDLGDDELLHVCPVKFDQKEGQFTHDFIKRGTFSVLVLFLGGNSILIDDDKHLNWFGHV